MSAELLALCTGLPVRSISAGDDLIVEGAQRGDLFLLRSGRFVVTRGGSVVAHISDPGSVIGEISFLLGTDAGATVTAVDDGEVHVVTDPAAFTADHPAAMVEIARTLARRLDTITGYLVDIRTQYADTDTHLGLLDEVLAELTNGALPEVDAGSEREPEPYA